ncbi:MAG: DUF72 domain-containing protein [Gammaproteobacteria bacterium]|jgi:hypothetical protein|nr:DUF72 domain-containing protein [Gammaproteobacteria bacterium]
MSEAHSPQLKLGTIGWEQGFEADHFYPDDLPEDWRLTYLSNELDRVAIPVLALQGVDEETVEEWEEDTHEQFRFYLWATSSDTPSQVAEALEQLSPLGEKLCAVLSEQPLTLNFSTVLLQPQTLKETMGEIQLLSVGGEVAIVEAQQELSPMVMRELLERLKGQQVDTLLFVPEAGLIANLANAETISALLG